MKVAVLSLTRDRLAYTQTCFASLRENAGCEYDHYVLDQGSTDGTDEWLMDEHDDLYHYTPLTENIGISRGMNYMLGALAEDKHAPYDVIAKYDNDCELVTPGALRTIAELTLASGWILGPVMAGYGTPLIDRGTTEFNGHTFAEKEQIQGCFLAATGEFYRSFRYSESNPVWGGDDAEICWQMRARGGHVGQVLGYHANHYETTWGQEDRYPEYFARKVAEGLPWP